MWVRGGGWCGCGGRRGCACLAIGTREKYGGVYVMCE